MTYTQAQIDKANAVDLEKFLRAQGRNAGTQRKRVPLESPRQPDRLRKQMVSAQPEQGRLAGGFRDEFYGKSFLEAVQMLTGEPDEAQPEADPALSGVSSAVAKCHQRQHPELSDAGAETQPLAGELLHRCRRYLRGCRPPQRGLCGAGCRRASHYANSRGIREKFRQDAAGAERRLALPTVALTSSCWSLKRPSTCCPSSNCSRKTGSSTIICRWAGCRAGAAAISFWNARTWSGCSSVWMLTKPERMPASVWLLCFRTP